MFLTTTSDEIRLTTDIGVNELRVNTSWVDYASGTVTPGRTDGIVGAFPGTSAIIGSPAASTTRKVKSISIFNADASISEVVTIRHFDGTNSVSVAIEKITLKPGEQFVMAEDGEWRHLTAFGAEYEYAGPTIPNLGITGTVAETCPRELCIESNIAGLTSGSLILLRVYLRAGQVVSNISFFSATTAAVTPTLQIFGLYGEHRGLLARSADAGTAAWPANTIKTLAMTTPYTVQKSGFYWIGALVNAGTVPTLKGPATTANLGMPDPLFTTGGTSLTAFPETMGNPSVSSNAGNVSAKPWAAIT